MTTFEECLKKGLIKPHPYDRQSIDNELAQSEFDLQRANDSAAVGDYKWATVQAYYSMFHAARALLYQNSYREKSHICIELFLGKLVNEGKLDQRYRDYFEAARDLRERADYDSSYSAENAEKSMVNARDFLDKIKSLVTPPTSQT